MTSSLDRQIAADPTDPAPYLVLADELLARGDRHGELIVLQSRKRTAKTAKREAELMKELAPRLFGELAKIATRRVRKGQRGALHLDWHMGFVRAVRFDCENEDEETALARMLPLFVKLPVARFLRRMSFGGVDAEDTNHDYGSAIELLCKHPPAATVNELFFGDFEHEDWEAKWNVISGLDKLAKQFPKLEVLRIHSCGNGLAQPLSLDGFTLRHLRTLEIVTDYAKGPALLAQIATLRHLTSLAIDFGVNGHDEPTIAHVGPFLAGQPPLTSLAFDWLDFGPTLVESLPMSKLAARIEHLALRSVHLHDSAVDVLLANKSKFPKLQSIDLELNYLTKPAQARLKKLCKTVTIGTQWKPKDDYLLVD